MAPFTGRKVLIFTVAAFGIVLAANLTLAISAVRTFPGLEVKNSYVASQNFDTDRTAQLALGWEIEAWIGSDSRLNLSVAKADGSPAEVVGLDAIFGRATHTRDDQVPAFVRDGAVFSAPVT